MIPLKYRCNDDILNQYYELVIRHKSRSYLEDIDKKCKKHFGVTFEYVVKSSPEQLKSLIVTLKVNNDFNTIKADFKDIKSRNSQKPNDYIVNVLYNNLPQEAKRLLFRSVGQKVCPYCNRNYIEEIRNNGEEHSRKITGTFELDHFYPKDEYPMFAVSFYNLIPVCGICNSIKNNQIFAQHPYDWNPDDVEFTYNIVGTEYLDNENDIEIQIRCNDNVKKQIEILYMTELYNGHKDVAQEIIKKVKYYNKAGSGARPSISRKKELQIPGKRSPHSNDFPSKYPTSKKWQLAGFFNQRLSTAVSPHHFTSTVYLSIFFLSLFLHFIILLCSLALSVSPLPSLPLLAFPEKHISIWHRK